MLAGTSVPAMTGGSCGGSVVETLNSNTLDPTGTFRQPTSGEMCGVNIVNYLNTEDQSGSVDEDNTVDMYVNPGDEIYDPNAAGFLPGARVMTARIWLVVRGVTPEVGIQQVRSFDPGDVNLGTPADNYRRMQVSKTILLRNART